jgi:hypothetical protein
LNVLSAFYFSILLGSILLVSENLPKNPPTYMHIDFNLDSVATSDFIFGVEGLDSAVQHQIYLLQNREGKPMLFYGDILTPVCIDDVCKPLYIELYWTLIGDYAGYGVYPEEKLSKFDHDLFTKDDYLKLDQLLRNPYSKLERKELEELYSSEARVGEDVEYNGQKIDGITGATIQDIKEEVVDGALYSCYTLWHLVHGKVQGMIKDYIDSTYNNGLQQTFLTSMNSDYQLYAINRFQEEDYLANEEIITEVLLEFSPLQRSRILKKLPAAVFSSAQFTQTIYGKFRDLDSNSKTILIENLHLSNTEAQLFASENLDVLTRNQLKLFFQKCELDHQELRSNILAFSKDKTKTYSYLAEDFLAKN